jgi:hypothetical protein
MRVRKSKQVSTPKFKGKFPSLKLDRTVLWESQLVQDYLYLLEFDADVLSYKEKPFKIDNINNSLRYGYTPNFLVERSNITQIIEIKAEDQLESEAGTPPYHLIDYMCRQEGYDFLIITDKEIQAQPRLSNIKLLWKYAKTPMSPQHQILCNDFMRRSRQATFSETVQFFESNGVTRQVVYAFMYWGMLVFDLMEAISADMNLQLPTATRARRKVS